MPPHTADRQRVARQWPRRVVGASAALLVFALTVAYRFPTMGGPLGGFENDQFVTLSQAQQIVMGEWPMRDFVELGMPLTVMLSAAGQTIIGHTLFAEAAVTIGMLALCSALLFLTAWRASGSILLALTIALIQIAMAPRFYNYPKLLAYAIAIPALWWYIDRPERRRLVPIALAGVIAFLLRHDHGLYVGLAGIAAVVIAQRPHMRKALMDVAVLGAIALAMVLPYLVYIQLHGGLASYFQSFVAYANQSAGRTGLRTPTFSLDWSLPPIVRMRPPPRPPEINVRWESRASAEARGAREQALGLVPLERLSDDVLKYALKDWSPGRLAAIVHDPLVADTQGIDRTEFTLNDPEYTRVPSRLERILGFVRSYRVLPGVMRSVNAAPLLYYAMYVVALLALALAAGVGDAASPVPWNKSAAKIGVVALLGLMTAHGFLRGNLPSRLADVSQVVGVLAAWLAAALIARLSGVRRGMMTALVVLALALVALSVESIEHVSSEVGQTRIQAGVRGIRTQAGDVRRVLSASPPVAAFPASTPGMERLARYVHECTRPDDRVLTLAYAPEVFFLSSRRFAAGNVWILPDFFTSDADQRLMIARIHAHRVPIAVTAPEPAYSADYVESFPLLTSILAREYREVRTVDFGRGFRYRVLVRRDLIPSHEYSFQELPCYS